MKSAITIRLLSTTTNHKGDLFTRLMDDLFFALGYEDIQHDVAKSGREIDVQGKHRTEPRLLRAECKAHKKTMGGAEVSKFRGALRAEQIKAGKKAMMGYFISLGGFTESAVEQENELGDEGIILVNAPQIVAHLERSHVLVSNKNAADQAGRCVSYAGVDNDVVIESIELLGHEIGYLKAVYYSHNKKTTHFALVHADGTPLAADIAQAVIDDDKTGGGELHKLQYLAPAPLEQDRRVARTSALEHYRRWIGEECGFIQLDGLPIDEKLSQKKLTLEKLFVPLRAIIPREIDSAGSENDKQQHNLFHEGVIIPIGQLLSSRRHVALLAAPGGGKSTLMKRLATAYAFSERRADIDDKLPDEDWLPLFLRCRTLGDRTADPVLKLLEEIAVQTSMPAQEADAFRGVVHERLRSGKVLLLIDGLDEIPDEGGRKSFANNLRTFLALFPQIAMVVTSREAGFRVVAGVIASTCQQAKLAPLQVADIRYLCEQWHVEVVRDSPQVREEAQKLANDICNNHNIFTLAQNPLLLTTLLVVKRSIGELPTNRAALYAEAVKLLVKTWNIEGFNALNEKEALAQLSYVACAMMEKNIKQIPHAELLNLLQESREVLAAELQYIRMSPEEFVEQVEYRSSLLMLSGRKMVEGELQPLYEFRHLTFQEYLAARGYVKKQHPRRTQRLSLLELLEPKFGDHTWREVIPLAAVLAELDAEPLIERLTSASAEGIPNEEIGLLESPSRSCVNNLIQCILDEVTISPVVMTAALTQLGQLGLEITISDDWLLLLRGRSGKLFQEIIEQGFISGEDGWEDYSEVLQKIAILDITGVDPDVFMYDEEEYADEADEEYVEDENDSPVAFQFEINTDYVQLIIAALEEKNGMQRIKAALSLMSLMYNLTAPAFIEEFVDKEPVFAVLTSQSPKIRALLEEMILSGHEPTMYAGAWAMAWGAGGLQLFGLTPTPVQVLINMFHAWRSAKSTETARLVAWALQEQPLLERDALTRKGMDGKDYTEFLLSKMPDVSPRSIDTNSKSVLMMAWYLGSPWNDEELADLIGQVYESSERRASDMGIVRNTELKRSAELLFELGEPGKRVLAERAKRLAKPVKVAKRIA